MEGELSGSDWGGGAGRDGEGRWRGELAAEARRFVVRVLATPVVLIGGEEQLQGPEKRVEEMLAKSKDV